MATIPEQLAAMPVTDTLKHAVIPEESVWAKLGWAAGRGSDTESGWAPPGYLKHEPDGSNGGWFWKAAKLAGGKAAAMLSRANTFSELGGVEFRQFSVWLFTTGEGTANGYQLCAKQTGVADHFIFRLGKFTGGALTVLQEVEAVMTATGSFAIVAVNGKVSIWIQESAGSGWVLLGEEVADATYTEGFAGVDGNGSNPLLQNFTLGTLSEPSAPLPLRAVPPPPQLTITSTTEGGNGIAYDLTDEADALQFSNTNPGGDEVCTFTIHRAWYAANPEIAKGNLIRIVSGIDVLWQGRVEEVDRATGDAEALLVTAYGLGNRLKDGVFQEIFIDKDLSRWGEASTQRKINVLAGSWAGRPYEWSWGVATGFEDTTQTGPGIIFTLGSAVVGTTPFGEQWYYGGGVSIGKFRFDFKQLSAWAEDPNMRDIPILSDNDIAGAPAEFDLIEPGYRQVTTLNQTLTATTSTRKYAVVQVSYTGNTAGQYTNTHSWLNLAIEGQHGLTEQGTWPAIGFTVDQMVGFIIGLTANVTARRIDTQSFVVGQAAYIEPIAHADGIADLNRYAGCDYGTWGPNSPLDNSVNGYFDFTSRDSSTQHWFVTRADFDEDLTFHTEISTLFDTVDVHWVNESGHEFTERLSIYSPDLSDANLSPRVFSLDAGTTTKAGAILLAEIFLDIFAGFAPARGQGSLLGYVRHYQRGKIPAYYMRANGANIRIPDILPAETAFALDSTPDRRTTFPLKRVTVDCSGDAPKTTVEFDQTSDALSVLLAQQALQASLVG